MSIEGSLNTVVASTLQVEWTVKVVVLTPALDSTVFTHLAIVHA